jgi:hypothetical protein
MRSGVCEFWSGTATTMVLPKQQKATTSLSNAPRVVVTTTAFANKPWLCFICLVAAVNVLFFDQWRRHGRLGDGDAKVAAVGDDAWMPSSRHEPPLVGAAVGTQQQTGPQTTKIRSISKNDRNNYQNQTTTTVAVVVMNHNRPTLLRDSTLIRTLVQHPQVGQILLLHSNPHTSFDNTYLLGRHDVDDDDEWQRLLHIKLQHVDAVELNREMGLAIRFQYCHSLVNKQSDWVMMVDDDMECQPTAISTLIDLMQVNPHRIVGKYGRTMGQSSKKKNGGIYRLKNTYGPVEIVLTKFMMMEKVVCDAFVRYQHLMDDLALSSNSRPIWNGEDIFVNLVANRLYQVPPDGPYTNLAVQTLPVWDITDAPLLRKSATGSVSGNPGIQTLWRTSLWDWWALRQKTQRHREQRSQMWRLGKDRLAQVVDVAV